MDLWARELIAAIKDGTHQLPPRLDLDGNSKEIASSKFVLLALPDRSFIELSEVCKKSDNYESGTIIQRFSARIQRGGRSSIPRRLCNNISNSMNLGLLGYLVLDCQRGPLPMPVMVLIQHPHKGEKALSVAVINRRVNKREQDKDVLGKGLIPEKLFHRADLAEILKDFEPDSQDNSQYYQAILQNLFFGTLNQRMGKNNKGESFRQFALDEGFAKNRATHDLNNYYRYESLFAQSPEEALTHFAEVPFLNGGLFECLDRRDEEAKKTYYLDGFSRNAKKRPQVPNCLFFADEIKGVDLSEVYHDKKRKKESVSGLIRILNKYKFTIVENTPIDQEIALDPELLGQVFENLLASYNEETKTTARKQTGSFYTPRPIVDYMVDESIIAHRCAWLLRVRRAKPDPCSRNLRMARNAEK